VLDQLKQGKVSDRVVALESLTKTGDLSGCEQSHSCSLRQKSNSTSGRGRVPGCAGNRGGNRCFEVWKIRVNGATAQTLTAVLGTNTGDWIGDVSTVTPDKSDIAGIYVGGAYSSVNFWHGILDEVRLSNVESAATIG